MPDSVTDSTGSRISSYFIMNAQSETTPSPVVPNTYLALPQNTKTNPNTLTGIKNECRHGLMSINGYNTEQCDMCRSIPCALCKSDSINKQDDHIVHPLKLSASRKYEPGSKAVYMDPTLPEEEVDSDLNPSVMIIT
jgi:hypothetical protein